MNQRGERLAKSDDETTYFHIDFRLIFQLPENGIECAARTFLIMLPYQH